MIYPLVRIISTWNKKDNLSESYILDAQMPFGGIVKPADMKEKEDISKRVKFVK